MFRWLAMLLVASLLVLSIGPGLTSNCMAIQDETKKQDEEKKSADDDQAEEAEAEEADPAEEAFEKLQSEAMKARREFTTAIRKASAEERAELMKDGGAPAKIAKKYLEFAKEFADSDYEFQAVYSAFQEGSAEVSGQAMEILADKFADDEKLIAMLPRMGRGLPTKKLAGFLETLSKKSSRDEVKGGAKYAIFQMMQSLPDIKAAIESRPELAGSIPEEAKEFIMMDHKFDSEAALDDLAKNFTDVKFGRSTLGKLAGDELFVVKYLSVGKEAPDIEGIDLDGEEFKLSDYRGKVVLLDFWGDW